MKEYYRLKIGDTSTDGRVRIIDKDRLCYLVESQSKGARGIRTISQKLLEEYVAYFKQHPDASANEARDELCGQTDIDRFEYGYTATLTILAKMVLNPHEMINESPAEHPAESAVVKADAGMFRRYATAIQSKPFVLLAGISGTGKSRIVRQLAFATGGESPDRVQKPFNYEMIQVRPNWHDSTELMGYETRISGDPEYKTTDFLRFLAKAWYFEDTPFFLCLDEMNLAPVEQYFAEYLSVLETRKLRGGKIETDPLVPALNSFGKKRDNTWVGDSILNDLFGDVWRRNGEIVDKDKGREALLRETFRTEGIGLPPNLIVMGTVNMDETTFSFSRKVLDRAMTLEMNEADLGSGLSKAQTSLPAIDAPAILPYAVEAVDVYESNRETCDIVIAYLNRINETLKGTPFKIAYRTRNEAILYVLSNLTYPDNDACYNLIRALDEVTDMKILSRIEGDKNKLMNWQQTGCILDDLKAQIRQQFDDIYKCFDATEGEKSMYDNMQEDSISLRKLEEMKRKLENTYYCTYWS